MACIVAVERKGAADGHEAIEYIFDSAVKARNFADTEADRKYRLRSRAWLYPRVQVQGESGGERVSWSF
jgi:hypothetical protein